MLPALPRHLDLAALLGALTFRPPAPAGPPPVEPAASRPLLRDCAATLEPFILESETALAAIGAVMTDLYAGAEHIRGDAESFRDAMATLADSASAQLHEIAAGLRDSTTRLHQSRTLIETLDHRLASLITDFASLEAGVREFRVLGTLIRIEGTTRATGSDDFLAISEQAAGIAANLGALVEEIRDATGALRVSFRAASHQLRRLTQTSQKTIAALLADVTALEAVLTAEHRSVGAAADGTMVGLERIRNSLGELVCALQIHDILRQQSEHSLASLTDLDHAPHLPEIDSHACRAVVRAQLGNTLALCGQAAASVASGLDSAGEQLARLATIAHDVAGLTSLDSPSRQALRASTAAILHALPGIEQGEGQLRYALDDLLAGSTAILAVVEKVSLAMLNMRWLGLNATIQSANRPQSRSAIETLGDRTAALAGAVDEECAHLREALGQLRQEVNEYSYTAVGSLGARGIRPIIEASAALFDQVHHTMHEKMQRQTDLQQTLRQKLEGAHEALAQFRRTLAAPARAAELLAPSPTAPLPETLSPAAAELLAAWLARYTMASERRAHCEALGLPFTEPESDSSAEGDIELF